MASTNKSGKYKGRSNALGHGGRAAQLRDQGVPGGVIGAIARSKGAAPGQANFHGKKGGKGDDPSMPDSVQMASSGGVKPFDPTAFAKMRAGLTQDKTYQQGASQRAAAKAKAPKPAPTAPKKPSLLDSITGMKTRRKA